MEKKALQAKLKPVQEKISVMKGKQQLQDCNKMLRPAARVLNRFAQPISAPFLSTRAAQMQMKAHHLPVRVAPRPTRAAIPPAGALPAPVRAPQLPSQLVSNGTTTGTVYALRYSYSVVIHSQNCVLLQAVMNSEPFGLCANYVLCACWHWLEPTT